jgi:hypothetical protein
MPVAAMPREHVEVERIERQDYGYENGPQPGWYQLEPSDRPQRTGWITTGLGAQHGYMNMPGGYSSPSPEPRPSRGIKRINPEDPGDDDRYQRRRISHESMDLKYVKSFP